MRALPVGHPGLRRLPQLDPVPDTLEALHGRGLKLGVISNWDPRLPDLLDRLRLSRFFDAVVYSSAVGVEKPDPRIFEEALRLLGVTAGEALHVGDGRLEDVEGAQAVGMCALHLTRGRGTGDLRDLSSLPGLLAGNEWSPARLKSL